jgi:acyl-CoA hydrolase
MTSREQEIQRRTDLSVTSITKAVFPSTTNHHNTLFGGTALAWMDEVSFIAATRFCRLPLVTVSTDRIDFNHPIAAGSIVELIGRVVKVGNTSLKVEVEVYVESMSSDGRELAIQGCSVLLPSTMPNARCRCCRGIRSVTSKPDQKIARQARSYRCVHGCTPSVAVDEPCEATSGCAAAVKPFADQKIASKLAPTDCVVADEARGCDRLRSSRNPFRRPA